MANPTTLTGKDGVAIAVNDHVRVDGSRAGTGIVDVVDVGAGKLWVRYDSLGAEYPRVFWQNATDCTKTG